MTLFLPSRRWRLALQFAASAFFAVSNSALATDSTVTISDPKFGKDIARVGKDGGLKVEQSDPISYYHHFTTELDEGLGCMVIAEPPPGKALIVRQVQLAVFQNPDPGPGDQIVIYADGNCTNSAGVGEEYPPTIGTFTVTFGPGVVIPAGSALSAIASGVSANTFVDGEVVDAKDAQSPNVSGRGTFRRK